MSIASRIRSKTRRLLAAGLGRRLVALESPAPLVTFTFDDAPVTAFGAGASILETHGARATYYVSLGLLGSETEVGPIADARELERAAAAGHELGCHTFDHLDAWHTGKDHYLASVVRNQQAISQLLPGYVFRTFAYPKSGPTLAVKRPLEARFTSCRGGGQTFNVGSIDLNLLSACFLDRRVGVGIDFVRSLVTRNAEVNGWLIFVTHDVSCSPSPYGCTEEFLEQVVRAATDSGARLTTVGEACRLLSLST